MSESAIDAASGPSLESILWRSLDQWTEPGLVDRDEFAAHIASAFDGEVPSETWVNRFFDGDPLDRMRRPADLAEAIVRSTRERLHVYEFDLRKLEYVIVEDREKVVVVSDFGQFAVEKDDTVSRLIEAAVLPESAAGAGAGASGSLGDRGGSDPRVYLVRENGQVVAVDVKKIARALDQLAVRQVATPAVDDPGSRLLPFGPVKRRMSEDREERALRQDVRTRQLLPPPALRYGRTGEGDGRGFAVSSAVPASAETTVFVLLPDGSLARPSIGSANRWQDMVSEWSLRAQSLTPGPSGSAMAVSGSQRFSMSAGTVVALFTTTGGAAAPGNPGFAGERALAQGDGISAVRNDSAPVRVLGDDELARAIAQGAMLVPGKTGAVVAAGGTTASGFWIQPESAFAASPSQQRALSLGGDPARSATLAQSAAADGAQPLQLGQITGDPWADWALSGGGDLEPSMLLAAKGRARQYLAAFGRDTDGPAAGPSARPGKGRQLLLNGAPALAFRAPDGSLVVQREKGTIRLAGIGRGDVSGDAFDAGAPGQQLSVRRRAALAERSGAIPATALAALQLALETSANASGFKLPMVKLESAADALETGRGAQLDAGDSRRSSARLAGPVVLVPGSGGQVAQMVLSMPFPNSGEVHVGSDLSEALQAYLGAPVLPAGSSGSAAGYLAPALGGLGGAGAGALVLGLRGGAFSASSASSGSTDVFSLANLGPTHSGALERADDAYVTLNLPSVRPLLGRGGSVSGLPALLQAALQQGGDWTPGPGAPMPSGIRNFAMQGPFDLPELVASSGAAQAGRDPQQLRALRAGEDEIVIPMPLWTQMGRGRLSSTDDIMASPLAPRGYAPPLGNYQLVLPGGSPIDAAGGAPAGTAGVLQLTGPTGLELATGSSGGAPVSARSLGGSRLLGTVALDDGESLVSRRGRGRIGAPLDPAAVASRLSAAQQGSVSSSPESIVSGSSPDGDSAGNVISGSQSASASTASARRLPSIDLPSPDGTFVNGSFAGGPRPMAGALQSALQLSSDVAGRTLPARPGTSLTGSSGASPSGSLSSDGGARFASRAAAAGRSQAQGFGAASTGTLVSGTSGSSSPAQVGSAASAQVASSVSSAASSASTARDAASRASIVSAGSASGSAGTAVAGLAPGAWSGARREDAGYQSWSYSSSHPATSISSGGVSLSSLGRPSYPSLPTALRFRYAGAPLWWSDSTRSMNSGPADDASADPASARALRSGVRAANSAAAIWRSIFVSGSSPSAPAASQGSGATGDGATGDDATGGMDGNWDAHALRMGSLGSRMDALAASSLVAGGAAAGAGAGKGAETVYVAMNGSGGAGAMRSSDVQKARAQALEMSIVAAIPPAPPPIETMGSGATGGDAPHARHRGHGHGGGGEQKDASEGVSQSKIEGSVDAVAQRIYHRIRRRIQSDRERFGG